MQRLKQRKGGRPASLDTKGKLALLLYHLHGKMDQRDLCQIFGIIPSTCSVTLSTMMPLLLEILKQEKDARIQYPQEEAEFKAFADQIAVRHPDLPCNVFGFMDGVFFRNLNHPDKLIQNGYYNGWKSGTSVTNVLVFTPDGCICWAAINRPGSWHDARVVIPLYDKLQNHTPPGYKLIADAAFNDRNQRNHIITPFKKGQFEQVDPAPLQAQLALHFAIVSARQPAEWGMRALQAAFPRLNVPLSASNTAYNQTLLSLCIHLYNFRTRRLGMLNQIQTVFSSDYISPIV
jgi:hypothetical protein